MNILFILTDQFRFDCLSMLGHPVVQTPNLDALAAESTLFSNAWCPTMACAPIRASLFTGYYADTHGMGGNQTVLYPHDRKVLPEYLTDAGYDTALVGKLHLKPMDRAFGFRHLLRHDAPYTNYSAEEATDSAYIRYLQENGVHIWDEWADERGDLGPVYGSQWRSWPNPGPGGEARDIDQLADVIEQIRANPDSRRLLVTAWNPAEVPEGDHCTHGDRADGRSHHQNASAKTSNPTNT